MKVKLNFMLSVSFKILHIDSFVRTDTHHQSGSHVAVGARKELQHTGGEVFGTAVKSLLRTCISWWSAWFESRLHYFGFSFLL